jgi:hypothetical protein
MAKGNGGFRWGWIHKGAQPKMLEMERQAIRNEIKNEELRIENAT